MSYATTSVATPPYLYLVGQSTIVSGAIAQFQRLSAADKLLVLRSVDTQMEPATPEASRTARFHLAVGLVAKVKQMTPGDRQQAMHALVANENTPFCRAYGLLGTRTKLAVWDLLQSHVKEDFPFGMTSHLRSSKAVQTLIDTIAFKFDADRKTTFMRQVVAEMGVDPLA